MPRTSHSSSFLRNILLIDATTCVAMAILLIVGSDLIERWLTIPALQQELAVIILLPFAAFVAYTGTRQQPAREAIWFIIAGNIGWVLASVALLLIDGAAFNLFGKAFIAAQAIAVALLAELEYFGMRRIVSATA